MADCTAPLFLSKGVPAHVHPSFVFLRLLREIGEKYVRDMECCKKGRVKNYKNGTLRQVYRVAFAILFYAILEVIMAIMTVLSHT